jgi:hypothetical protein
MMTYWCHLYQVDVNMESLMGFRGLKLQRYRQVGGANIRKGTALTNPEAQAAIMGAFPNDYTGVGDMSISYVYWGLKNEKV